MNDEKLEIESQLSNLIQQDFVELATIYSQTNSLDNKKLLTFIQDLSLLNKYEVSYNHNSELNDVIEAFKNEFNKTFNPYEIAFLIAMDYLQSSKRGDDFLQKLFVELFIKTPKDIFIPVFNIFSVLCGSVQELYSYFIKYIFNTKFLTLDENIQVDCIYKAWNLSLQVFHDNKASKYAYGELLKLFHEALNYQKTEVAFWLYYTPLHYYKSGVSSDIDKTNEEFKNEVEKPLEEYILKYIVPKYDIKPNKKEISKGKKRVAFVMQRIIRHSTMNVFLRLLKALMAEKNSDYEFVIYDLNFAEANGSDNSFVEEFKKLGIEYVDVHGRVFGNMNQTYSLLEKCIKTRKILIEDGVDILIGLHTRVEYIFLYATRTAPKQIYWYHGSNAQYDIKEIDERITHCSTKENKFLFKQIKIPIDFEAYNPKIDKEIIKKEREKFPKGKFILGSIGRLIKIDNTDYLNAVAQIMENNPNTIYLACGSGDQNSIKEKVKKLGLLDRFYFTGQIDSHLYGNIIELYLTPFDTGGESLDEYRYKGRPYIFLVNKNTPKVYYKNNKFLKNEFYSLENIKNIEEKGYLFPWNNFAQVYFCLGMVNDQKIYVNAAIEFIKNKEIRDKSIIEFLHNVKINNNINLYRFFDDKK